MPRRHGRNLRDTCGSTRTRVRIPRRPPPEKHCAAQAEYGRLAAQAYSPSDAMSQARFCLGGMEKGSTPPEMICRAICGHSKMRVAVGAPPAAAASYCRRLFLTRWIRLPRRHMGSRWRVRPDRLRYPRGLRGPAEAQAPCEEMSAILLKHRQDWFVGDGNLYMHAASHSVPHLDGRFR